MFNLENAQAEGMSGMQCSYSDGELWSSIDAGLGGVPRVWSSDKNCDCDDDHRMKGVGVEKCVKVSICDRSSAPEILTFKSRLLKCCTVGVLQTVCTVNR